MKYLLDTDICIYWLKGNNAVKTKVLSAGTSEISICSITVAELYFGAYNSSKINENLATVDNFINSISVLNLTINSLKKFGELKANLRQEGTPYSLDT
jgi:tRNA(fMet)-specific endonuclease VapC